MAATITMRSMWSLYTEWSFARNTRKTAAPGDSGGFVTARRKNAPGVNRAGLEVGAAVLLVFRERKICERGADRAERFAGSGDGGFRRGEARRGDLRVPHGDADRGGG